MQKKHKDKLILDNLCVTYCVPSCDMGKIYVHD